MRAQILTPWGRDADGLCYPAVFLDHPLPVDRGFWWEDVTGEPEPVNTPTPNPVVIRVVCDQATLDAIQADNNYGPGAILWVEA